MAIRLKALIGGLRKEKQEAQYESPLSVGEKGSSSP